MASSKEGKVCCEWVAWSYSIEAFTGYGEFHGRSGFWYKKVIRSPLKDDIEPELRILCGSEFQVDGAEKAEDCWPIFDLTYSGFACLHR